MKMYYIAQSPTPLDQLHNDFIPTYQRFTEYAEVGGLFVAMAGVMVAVIKSARK